MYIPHFICSSLDEHMDCFHFFALVNNVAMNTGVQVSESLFSVLYGMYLGVELLSHMVILCLTF